jgi:alpha-aminoadipate/glutamate carrier protein LysW
MVTCPACDAVLDVEEEELDEGDELTCDECGETLSVAGTDPLELHVGEEDEDDEEEEEDFDEFDEEDEDEEEEEEEEDEDW